MNYVVIELADATVEQLRSYAEMLGGEIPEKPTKANLMALIDAIRPGGAPIRIPEQTYNAPAIEQSSIPADCMKLVRETRTLEDGTEQVIERIWVGIRLVEDTSNTKGGKHPVPVSVNGVRFDVPRNQAVWIPKEFHDALDNARRYEYDSTDRGLAEPREVHDYPFNYVRPEHAPEDQGKLARELVARMAAA
jgi:hypothetical protein